jgi:hypothetical protein
VVFPSEIRPMPGNKDVHGAYKCLSGLSAVSLRPCGPLALVPVNEKKTNLGAKFGPKMAAADAPGVAGR